MNNAQRSLSDLRLAGGVGLAFVSFVTATLFPSPPLPPPTTTVHTPRLSFRASILSCLSFFFISLNLITPVLSVPLFHMVLLSCPRVVGQNWTVSAFLFFEGFMEVVPYRNVRSRSTTTMLCVSMGRRAPFDGVDTSSFCLCSTSFARPLPSRFYSTNPIFLCSYSSLTTSPIVSCHHPLSPYRLCTQNLT